MRPVERGVAPREYARYQDAIGDLENRLGKYCSYCERHIPVGLAVEHMAPKSLHPDREVDWNNFLLGCTNCNSVKDDGDLADDDILWPDRHNTMRALAYSRGGFVRLAGGLISELQRRAQTLIDLVGLDRHGAPGWSTPAKRDERWRCRESVWALAERCRASFEASGRSNDALELVLAVATGYGFFSVWLAVFDEHADVKLALIAAFPGTAESCFSRDGTLVNRPGAEI